MSRKVVYVDVDDTLMRSFGSKRIPVTHIASLIPELKKAGATLFCWSTAGSEYARAVTEQLGIAECFSAFLPKPEILIDDRQLSDWKVVELHPNECRGMNAEEVLAQAQTTFPVRNEE